MAKNLSAIALSKQSPRLPIEALIPASRSRLLKAILAKIDTLSVPQWNYKSEDPSVRHIGPVAQDFYATFGLGNNDTSISTVVSRDFCN